MRGDARPEPESTRAAAQQAVDEAALARLLRDAMVAIRFELAPLRDNVPERQRMRDAWIVADLCHNLPSLLDPSRRPAIREGIEHEWRTSSEPRRAWIRSRWDGIGYDYSWLPDEPGGGPEPDRGWPDPDLSRNDQAGRDHDEGHRRN